MTPDEEKPGEWEQTYRRGQWLSLLRVTIPDWIRVRFLRVSTRWKIRRIRSEYEAIRERYRKAYGAQAMASDPEDREFGKIVYSEQMEVNDLHMALDEAETHWFEARAVKQRVPFPHENLEDDDLRYRLKPESLREFKDVVVKAERETWRHRREWMAFVFAVLFGVVTTVSVFYNMLSTQRKLNDIQGNLKDTQSVLADTQARLNDAQRKLTDLTEQVRRREVITVKRGTIPRAR
jgi:hypothetical protein